MRRYFATWLILCPFFLSAAPVGNSAAPRMIQEGFFIPRECWVNVRTGYEGDFVANGQLKQTKDGTGRVDDDAQITNSATVTLNILDRLDLYGVFGSSRSTARWRFQDVEGRIHHVHMKTFSNFLWGIGGHAILFECGPWDLGFGGRYSSTHNHSRWLSVDGARTSVAGTHYCWRQWQLNCDVSYHIKFLFPYLGVKYSNVRTHLGTFPVAISESGSGNNHFANRVPFGLYVGCGLSTEKYFMFNIEGRFIDEEAVTLSGDLRF